MKPLHLDVSGTNTSVCRYLDVASWARVGNGALPGVYVLMMMRNGNLYLVCGRNFRNINTSALTASTEFSIRYMATNGQHPAN